jgi:DNA-binding transcriptional LysR family regulator
MDFLINLGARIQGLTATVMDALPLLGAVGGILGVGASILTRAAAAHDPAGVLHAIHPTPEEGATFALCVATLKAHFNHQANAKAIDAHADALNIPKP